MRPRRLVSGSSVLTSHSLRFSRPGIAAMAATIWAYGGWVGACFSITLMTLETRRCARPGRAVAQAYIPRTTQGAMRLTAMAQIPLAATAGINADVVRHSAA